MTIKSNANVVKQTSDLNKFIARVKGHAGIIPGQCPMATRIGPKVFDKNMQR